MAELVLFQVARHLKWFTPFVHASMKMRAAYGLYAAGNMDECMDLAARAFFFCVPLCWHFAPWRTNHPVRELRNIGRWHLVVFTFHSLFLRKKVDEANASGTVYQGQHLFGEANIGFTSTRLGFRCTVL